MLGRDSRGAFAPVSTSVPAWTLGWWPSAVWDMLSPANSCPAGSPRTLCGRDTFQAEGDQHDATAIRFLLRRFSDHDGARCCACSTGGRHRASIASATLLTDPWNSRPRTETARASRFWSGPRTSRWGRLRPPTRGLRGARSPDRAGSQSEGSGTPESVGPPLADHARPLRVYLSVESV